MPAAGVQKAGAVKRTPSNECELDLSEAGPTPVGQRGENLALADWLRIAGNRQSRICHMLHWRFTATQRKG